MSAYFELSAIPAITAAALDWATVKYILPRLSINPFVSGASLVTIVIGWLIQAVAIYLGIVLGNYINNAVFRR